MATWDQGNGPAWPAPRDGQHVSTIRHLRDSSTANQSDSSPRAATRRRLNNSPRLLNLAILAFATNDRSSWGWMTTGVRREPDAVVHNRRRLPERGVAGVASKGPNPHERGFEHNPVVNLRRPSDPGIVVPAGCRPRPPRYSVLTHLSIQRRRQSIHAPGSKSRYRTVRVRATLGNRSRVVMLGRRDGKHRDRPSADD